MAVHSFWTAVRLGLPWFNKYIFLFYYFGGGSEFIMRQARHIGLCHMGLTGIVFLFTWDLYQVINAFASSCVKWADTFLLSSGLICLVPQSPWIQAFKEIKMSWKIFIPVRSVGFGKTSMDFRGFGSCVQSEISIIHCEGSWVHTHTPAAE